MCVIWPNTFGGLVSICLKSLPPKYYVQKCKTHHGRSKNHFLSLHGVDGITTFISAWKNVRLTRTSFVCPLPPMIWLYNHPKRVLWINSEVPFCANLPKTNRNDFFQKSRKMLFFENHLQNSYFQRAFGASKKETLSTFLVRKIHPNPRFVRSLPSIQPVPSKLILWKVWEPMQQY